MVRFAPADLFDDETPAADPRGAAPVALPRRRSRRLAAPRCAPTNPLLEQAFPSWARPPNAPAAGADAGVEAAFLAGAGLALLDQILRTDPPFAGALRQRLALRAAAACAAAGAPSRGFFRAARRRASFAQRRRERAHQPRRPHPSAVAPVSPRPTPLDASTLRIAADLLDLSDATSFEGFADALRHRLPRRRKSARGGRGRERRGDETVSRGAARRRRDFRALAVGPRLGATTRLGRAGSAAGDGDRAAVAASAGRRPRPGDADWPLHCATAVALAAREAHGLAGDLSRRSAKLLSVAPNLRAKGAGRVIEMLLADDAVSPATAAKAARLSDRASRRLFDRLVELGVVRELSGRPSFRLYGL